ncbi:GNAT family N-acetyltransferase [Thalassococcus sp. S3]|uniref:GNAT family N-acetyltransferase n=1 Tax=Thalassococcus sp. S3 TaxID=2017482 RepID=UPI0010247416|nr:GNAT family N-acetyltransferase [Thalassococcus sp. S3]QBF29936.1 GNAT family N-acetyltransferase [Thalassococcus sp. S3]
MTLAAPLIPTLETERLILRPPSARDLPPFAAFYASDAAEHVGGPRSEAETWRYLCEVIGHWTMRGFGRWMVTLKDNDTAIGLVGLHFPLNWPEPEIGWAIWSGTGRGYATEAAQAARRYGYDTLGWSTAMSMIAPGNEASVRVALRLGATRDEDHDHPDHGPLMIYRHPGPGALS